MRELIDYTLRQEKKWRKLDKNTTDLTQQEANTLKWALEVVIRMVIEPVRNGLEHRPYRRE